MSSRDEVDLSLTLSKHESKKRIVALQRRLLHLELVNAGLIGSGMIGDPDPYTAAINALELFRVDDVVISTLPGERSGWMRSNLIERVRHNTSAKVEHVVVDLQATATPAVAG